MRITAVILLIILTFIFMLKFDAAAYQTVPPFLDNGSLELVGSFGGQRITSVAAQGQYVYGGLAQVAGHRFTVWDASDSSNLEIVGQTAVLPYEIKQVSVQGSYAYMAASGDGLHIIDISNPEYPVEIGFIDMWDEVRSVTPNGNYVYVAAGFEGMHVVDISDPSHPVEVGLLDTPGVVNEIMVSGNYAYIADGFSSISYPGRLIIADMTEPQNPHEIQSFNFNEDVQHVATWGNYVFVIAHETDYGLPAVYKLNVSNPLQPIQEGIWASGGYQTNETDIAAKDGYIYLTGDGFHYSLVVLDADNFVELGRYQDPGRTVNVSVAGNYAYVVDTFAGLRVINVNNPNQPVQTSIYKIFPPVIDIVFSENNAYLAAAFYGLQITDIFPEEPPTLVGFYEQRYIQKVKIINSLAFMAVDKNFTIFDISEPTSPEVIGNYVGPITISDFVLTDNYAYVAFGWQLQILNISDPHNPVEVGNYDLQNWVDGLDKAGDFVFTVSYSGIRILDIFTPENPAEVGFLDVNGFSIAVWGDYAFVAAGEDGLRVIDVSDPTQPVEVSLLVTPGLAQSVTIVDHYLYVADGDEGVIIFDVAASPDLLLLGQNNEIPYASYVTRNDNLVYAVDATRLLEDEIGLYRTYGSGTVFVLHQSVSTVLVSPEIGGELRHTNRQGLSTSLQVPAGAVTAPTTLLYVPTKHVRPPGNTAVAGQAFDLTAYRQGNWITDLTFQEPVTLTIAYSQRELEVFSDKENLAVLWNHNNSWLDASESCASPSTAVLDTQEQTITIPICRSGQFALTGPTNQVVFPYIH